MPVPDSAPEELKILEQLQDACLQKMRSNVPLEEKKAAMKDFQEIQRLKKTYIETWGEQTGNALQKASEELARQATKFGLKWPR